MKKISFSLLAVLALLVTANVSHASILTSLLSFDGVVDTLQDESRSFFADNDSSGGFSVGDVIYGYSSISDITPDPPDYGANQVAVLFSFQVTGVAGGVATLGTTTVAGQDIASLTGVAPVTNGLGTAAFVVVANTGAFDPLVDGTGGNTITTTDFATYFQSPDWTYQFTGGYATGLNQFNDTDYSEFAVVGAGGLVGTQVGGFSALDAPDFTTAFLPISSTDFGGTTTSHDVNLFDATVFTNSDIGTDGWTFRDNAKFSLNVAVPEPGSIAIWGLIVGIGCFMNGRRRGRLVA